MEKHKILTNKRFRRFYVEFTELMRIYREQSSKKPIDWKEYERTYADRIKYVGRELNALAKSAIPSTKVNKYGRPPKMSVQQKVVALLLKSIFHESNRPMAGLMSLFGAFCGIDVSYKTIERLYSDEMVRMTLHNMFVLAVKDRCEKKVDVTGDGTGYSLTVTKHYRTNVDKEGYRKFVYSFNLMDMKTKMYVCHGSGIRSEKEAFKKAIEMLRKVEKAAGIIVNSARFDKYYSYQSTLKYFDDETVFYLLPRQDTKINGPLRWRKIFRRMMADPLSYLAEYYRRENSESGFAADKKMVGWKVGQRREDRIDTAIGCIATLHNLFRMGYG